MLETKYYRVDYTRDSLKLSMTNSILISVTYICETAKLMTVKHWYVFSLVTDLCSNKSFLGRSNYALVRFVEYRINIELKIELK